MRRLICGFFVPTLLLYEVGSEAGHVIAVRSLPIPALFKNKQMMV